MVLFMLVFAKNTSLDYWRWRARTDARPITSSFHRIKKIPRYTPNIRAAFNESAPFRSSEPLTVLVASPNFVNNRGELACSVRSGLFPKHSFCSIAPETFVTSPMLAFLDAASFLDLIELVLLGCELTACYALDPNHPDGFLRRSPLIRHKDLVGYLNSMKGYPHQKVALKAVKHVIENSASPMETRLALLLTLPRRLGGFGLPQPVLNHSIDIDPERRGTYPWHHAMFDLFWEEGRLDVEYDSSQFHSSPKKLEEDSIRRNAIRSHNYDVITITGTEFAHNSSMIEIARNISRRIGYRLPKIDLVHMGRMDTLRNRLMDH